MYGRVPAVEMRSITFVLVPPTGANPAYRMFEEAGDVRRERIHYLNVLADGTMVLVGRLGGNVDRARAVIEESEHVLGYSVSTDGGSGAVVYVRSRPPPEIREFLELPRTHEVFFDFPIEGTESGNVRVTMVAETNERLQRALADVPSELRVDVERLGTPPLGPDYLGTVLTDRQREVLDVAMALGYYDVPRTATHRDVADRLELSVGTVGEHLQKIEARVFASLGG
jgi:DNA-binding CsgD family transcriptional regulator